MFQTPLGLLAFAALPVVVALHLFRRRFRPQAVSALFLWQRYDDSVRTGRTRERLHRSASFWCELLAAALIALALAGPRACGSGQATHLVVVLDTSASMGALGADGTSARERALAVARERMGELGASARVTLVGSGPRPELLAGPAVRVERALGALADYRTERLGHALGPAIAFAVELAGAGRVLVLSDRLPEQQRGAIESVAVGESRGNHALARATRRRVSGVSESGVSETGFDRVFLAVQNFAEARSVVRGKLVELGDHPDESAGTAQSGPQTGLFAAEFEFDVEAGGRASGSFDLPPGTGPVEVALAPDALALDDRAVLAPDEPRRLDLRCDLDPELAHWWGLAPPESEPGAAPALARALTDVRLVAPGAPAHVVIAHLPAQDLHTWSLVVPELGPQRADFGGPFLRELGHPALVGATLEGVVWSADPQMRLPGRAIAFAGELGLMSESAAPVRLWLNLDPWKSSLHRSPDWPILIANLVERRRELLPGPRAANVLVGEPYERRGVGPGALRLRGPNVDREHQGSEPLLIDELLAPGLYRLERNGTALAQFGVHFADPAESDLRGLASGVQTPNETFSSVRSDVGWLETALLAGALLLLLVDWIVLAGWPRILGTREAGA